MPKVKVVQKNGWHRHDIVKQLHGSKNIGIELGVATGIYAKRMIESNKFQRFYGVDVYGDTHDTEEYLAALKYIGHQNPIYSLLRMDFDNALDLFDDNYFDFIYIDGYAHTGEEGGRAIVEWMKKLKHGGILAGDDYHNDWPLVKWAVNDIVKQLDTELYVTTEVEKTGYCHYPSWFICKNNDIELQVNPDLYHIAMTEKIRIHNKRMVQTHARQLDQIHKKIDQIQQSIVSIGRVKRLFRKILSFRRVKRLIRKILSFIRPESTATKMEQH
jgi:SAM-dependent methyltransferase